MRPRCMEGRGLSRQEVGFLLSAGECQGWILSSGTTLPPAAFASPPSQSSFCRSPRYHWNPLSVPSLNAGDQAQVICHVRPGPSSAEHITKGSNLSFCVDDPDHVAHLFQSLGPARPYLKT